MPAPTVLIVANPYEAEMLRRAVKEGGMRPVMADGGEGALDLFEREMPSVVLVSAQLIAVSAAEILAGIRGPGVPRVPAILIDDPGGHSSDPARARALGADLVLLRPIDPVLLMVKIEQMSEDAEEELELETEIELIPDDDVIEDEEPTKTEGPKISLPSWPPEVAPMAVRTEVLAPPVAAAPAGPRLAEVMAAIPQPDDLQIGPAKLAGSRSEPMAVVAPPPAQPAASASPALGSRPTEPMAAAPPQTEPRVSPAPPVLGSRSTEPQALALSEKGPPAPVAAPQVHARVTEPMEVTLPEPPKPTAPRPTRTALLRADDAMDFSRTIPDAPPLKREPVREAATQPGRPAGFRRRLEDDMSAAEKRLSGSFRALSSPPPDGNALPREPAARGTGLAGYEDALGDVDLDKLGVDTLPGIELELGLERPRRTATPAAFATPVPPVSAATPLERPPARPEPPPTSQVTDSVSESVPLEPVDLNESGDLGEVGLPELLARFSRGGFTGRLALRRGEGEKAIFFDGGDPVYATSSLPYDHIADLLWREGRLTRDQHVRAREVASESPLRAAEAMVREGLLPRDDLFRAVRRQVEEVIYSSFAWERGAWSLSSTAAAPDEKVRIELHPYAMAIEGIRRKYGLERLTRLVGPPSTPITPTPALERLVAAAALSDKDRAAARRLIDGAPLTVAELATRAGSSEVWAYALVYGLIAVGGASRGAAAPVEGARAQMVDRERALAKYAQVSDGDYFSVLGVAPDASAYEIRRAWERLRQEFSADGCDPAARDELGDRLGEIAEVIDEAYRVLADDGVREAYRDHLPQAR